MITYAYDLYPRDDPKDGARLVRMVYTGLQGALQSAEYRAEANGTGAGKISIRGDTTAAGFIDPRGLQYVRVVRIDTDTVDGATLSGFDEEVIGGFFLDSGDFAALDKQGTRLLTFGGAGTLSYLGREVLWSRSYFYAADVPIIDSTWHFYNQPSMLGGDFLGAVLYRVTQEAGSFASPVVEVDDKPETAIPDASTGVSMGPYNDSAGNAWTVPSGEFKAQVGENILTIVKRLMESGLYIEMNPDTFVINAWEQVAWPGHTLNSRGQDKSGAAWGLVGGAGTTYIVRFQAPTDGTIATGNVLSDAKRGVAAFTPRSAILAGDNGTYVVETVASDVPWHGYYPNDSQNADTLSHIADSQIGARSDAGDTLRVRMKHGTDAANGEYLPLSDYDQGGVEPSGVVMLNDLVTVHTGTGQWDYNEDTFPVAALTIVLREGGDWDAWADLGSTYSSMAERAFQARGVGTHTHPPNPQLCEPGNLTTPEFVRANADGASDPGEELQITVDADDLLLLAFFGNDGNPGSAGHYDERDHAGASSQALTLLRSDTAGADHDLDVWYLDDPDQSTSGSSHVTVASDDGRFALAVALYSGVDSTEIRSSGTATGSSASPSAAITCVAGDRVVAALSYHDHGASEAGTSIAEAAGWNERTGAVSGGTHSAGIHLIDKIATATSETAGWTLSVSRQWTISYVVLEGSGSSGDTPQPVGGNEEGAVGTSGRAARCDHVHAHSDLSDHPDETHHHAQSVEFTPTGDITATDVQAAIAEVAAEVEAGTDPTDLIFTLGSAVTIIDDATYNAFPGICRLADGTLIVVYRQGTDHSGTDDGRILKRTSTDDGATWSAATTVYDPATDARDPQITLLSDGTLIVSFFLYTDPNATHVATIRSTDDGATWDTPVTVTAAAAGFSGGQVASSASIVELDDGQLVFPIYGLPSGGGAEWDARTLFSDDRGGTWGSAVTIEDDAGNDWTEPYIYRFADGELLCLIRVDDINDIYSSRSTDNGLTWSDAAFAFDGSGRPAMVQMRSGALVCIYRKATALDVVYRVSWDHGATWADETTIDASSDSQYASAVPISDQAIGIVYGLGGFTTNSDVFFRTLTDDSTITEMGHTRFYGDVGFFNTEPVPQPTAGGATTSETVEAIGEALQALGLVNFTGEVGADVTDHGALTGLADDDHTQYQLESTLTDAIEAAGRWEVLMADGVTYPPDPLMTEDGTDWLYGWVSG